MSIGTNMIASLGLIAGIGLTTLTPANAALSPGESSTPGATTLESSMPPVSNTPSAMSAHKVALIQESLDSTGANLRIDGVWGPATEAALKHYQQQHGLQVTGQIDPATRTMLDPVG